MQTFEQYLLDIFKTGDDDIDTEKATQDEFHLWYERLSQHTLFNYANDYAKDCMRVAREKIHKGIETRMVANYKELGTNKHDWAYEGCLEIVDNNLK